MGVLLQEQMILEMCERHSNTFMHFQAFIFQKLWNLMSFWSSDFLLLLTTGKFLYK